MWRGDGVLEMLKSGGVSGAFFMTSPFLGGETLDDESNDW